MNRYDHQQSFLDKNPNKSALVWSCGIGKTRTACEWIAKNGKPALVICPKSLKANWKRELTMWESQADVLTKEEFRKVHKILMRYDQIVVDEVHNGFLTPHFKSQMSKALRWYLQWHRVPRVLLLSATVYSSSPWNIYNLVNLLGYKVNWQQFNMKFFNQVRMGRKVIPVPKKNIEVKLANIVKKIADVVNINDVMDVPLQLHAQPEYFAFTREQKLMVERSYDPVPIVRFTKQHEIEQGILKGDRFSKDMTFDCDKNDRILALCEENPKIVIVCRYNLQLDAIYALISPLYATFLIRGDAQDRDGICRAAEIATHAVVLLQADCGIGFELPSFPVCVFASMSYSYVSWEQCCGRFLRMNKPSRTTFLYLLTEGDSMDKAIYDAVQNKKDFSIELYAKKRG